MKNVLIDLLALAFLGASLILAFGGALWALQGDEDITERWWREQEEERKRKASKPEYEEVEEICLK